MPEGEMRAPTGAITLPLLAMAIGAALDVVGVSLPEAIVVHFAVTLNSVLLLVAVTTVTVALSYVGAAEAACAIVPTPLFFFVGFLMEKSMSLTWLAVKLPPVLPFLVLPMVPAYFAWKIGYLGGGAAEIRNRRNLIVGMAAIVLPYVAAYAMGEIFGGFAYHAAYFLFSVPRVPWVAAGGLLVAPLIYATAGGGRRAPRTSM